LLRLLGLLQRRPRWNGIEMAEQLAVTTRTLRRDVERLRTLGYVVESAPGRDGGYRLLAGSDLPPLLLDDDEATAMAVALGSSAGAALWGIETPALSALTKLDRLLPTRVRTQVAAIRASTIALSRPAEVLPADRLVPLARACESQQLVSFPYAAADGRHTVRRAEPYRLVATDRRWYLVAYDLDRQDWRTFRVDRMVAVPEITGHTFVPRHLADPGRLVADALSTAPYRYQAVVKVGAPAAEVEQRVPPTVGIVEPAGRRAATLRMGADDFEWLASRLVGLGLPFEVLEPNDLREHFRALGEAVLRAHSAAERSRPASHGAGASVGSDSPGPD
jgi:predicted DNA-binding transcriptional regulator YafY